LRRQFLRKEERMSAAIDEEKHMLVEDRIARIESDVAELNSDVKTLNTHLSDFRIEVAKEFGSVRAEIRGSVESLKTSIERTKVWMLGTGITTVLGVAAIVGLKLH
jgi:uncharacterized protein YlxW (UPF0749 family)